MKSQKRLIVSLVIVLILVIFACLNTEQVAINFGFVQPKMPLIIILITMLLLGAFISMLLGNEKKDLKEDKAKYEKQISKKYESQLKQKDQEIANLNKQLKDLKSKSISE